MTTLKKLPASDQTFTAIIDQDFLYADKTKYIYNLLRIPQMSYFLSRPRSFGKTLLLQAIDELFTGGRELFKGLWIGQSYYAFPIRPVLHLNFSLDSGSPKALKAALLGQLEDVAKAADLQIEGDRPGIYFCRLIEALKERSNSRVVLLIDEHYAPVARSVENLEVAQANAKALGNFLAILKVSKVASCIHFALVAGVTRHALRPRPPQRHLPESRVRRDMRLHRG